MYSCEAVKSLPDAKREGAFRWLLNGMFKVGQAPFCVRFLTVSSVINSLKNLKTTVFRPQKLEPIR
jgi:hypothetical protein